MINKKKALSFTAGVLALSAVVGSYAYFAGDHKVINELQTNAATDYLFEKFTPDDSWGPGNSATKETKVVNSGDSPVLVRVKLTETWTLANGNTKSFNTQSNKDDFFSAQKVTSTTPITYTATQGDTADGGTTGDKSVVYKVTTLNNSSGNWVYYKGYYYYKKPLEAKNATNSDETDNFLSEIILCNNTDMGFTNENYYYTFVDDLNGKTPTAISITGDMTTGWKLWAEGDSVDKYTPPTPPTKGGSVYMASIKEVDTNLPGYSDAKYDLKIEAETIEVTKAAVSSNPGWNISSAIPGTSWGIW